MLLKHLMHQHLHSLAHFLWHSLLLRNSNKGVPSPVWHKSEEWHRRAQGGGDKWGYLTLDGEPTEGWGDQDDQSGCHSWGLPPSGAVDLREHCSGICIVGNVGMVYMVAKPTGLPGTAGRPEMSYTWCESHSKSGYQQHSGCRIPQDPMNTDTVPQGEQSASRPPF